MHALALTLVVALGSAAATDEPTAPAKKPMSDSGRVGVALLAGGAGLAATTAAGSTLLTALTTPDDNRNKPAHPEITQVSGFAIVALGSLSAGLVLVGGALFLGDAMTP